MQESFGLCITQLNLDPPRQRSSRAVQRLRRLDLRYHPLRPVPSAWSISIDARPMRSLTPAGDEAARDTTFGGHRPGFFND